MRRLRARPKEESSGAADLDIAPILNEDNRGHGDRNEDGQRNGGSDRNKERKQGHRDEGFAEPKRRSNHRGEENHGQHW